MANDPVLIAYTVEQLASGKKVWTKIGAAARKRTALFRGEIVCDKHRSPLPSSCCNRQLAAAEGLPIARRDQPGGASSYGPSVERCPTIPWQETALVFGFLSLNFSSARRRRCGTGVGRGNGGADDRRWRARNRGASSSLIEARYRQVVRCTFPDARRSEPSEFPYSL